MDELPNLDAASRADLLELIAAQQQTIATLQAALTTMTERVRVLEGQSGKGRPPRPMPGTNSTQPTPIPPRPRTPRQQAFVRPRGTPTATVTHAPGHCRTCGTVLAGGWVQRTREVIDLTLPSVTITKHQFVARTCPCCEKRVIAQPDLADVVVGRQRLGIGLTSFIVTLREELRLPVAGIRRLLASIGGLTLSAGSIIACCQRVAAMGAPTVARWREAARTSPVLHADETGWRENGQNGYVWTLSTPTVRTFSHGRRSTEAFHAALGGDYTGTLVSDFYSVYAAQDGPHQWCWAHLLRDIHDLKDQWPEDQRLAAWATTVRTVFDAACVTAVPPPFQRGAVLTTLSDRLMAVCTPFLTDASAPQRRLCRRIEKHLGGLFTFVVEPEVPPDNNAAERSLRHLVTARKISGGTRSPSGTATKMTLASLFGTWRLTGLNPLESCRSLLVSPQP